MAKGCRPLYGGVQLLLFLLGPFWHGTSGVFARLGRNSHPEQIVMRNRTSRFARLMAGSVAGSTLLAASLAIAAPGNTTCNQATGECAPADSVASQMMSLANGVSPAMQMTSQIGRPGMGGELLANGPVGIMANRPALQQGSPSEYNPALEMDMPGSDMTTRWAELEAQGAVPSLSTLNEWRSEEAMMHARNDRNTAPSPLAGPEVGSDAGAALGALGFGAGRPDSFVGGNNIAAGVTAEQGASAEALLADNPMLARVASNPMYIGQSNPMSDAADTAAAREAGANLDSFMRLADRVGSRNSAAGTPNPMSDPSPSSAQGSSGASPASALGGVGRPTNGWATPRWDM